ncbi:hypothetical protein [Mycobacterium sp.]|uniref:hypothetical protein n=1 Tax=Mycobacterium sp. TaxID=1785 RepID=UPI003F9C041D
MTTFTGDPRALAILAFHNELAAMSDAGLFAPMTVEQVDRRRKLALWLVDEFDDPLKPLSVAELACRSLAEALVVLCDEPLKLSSYKRWGDACRT